MHAAFRRQPIMNGPLPEMYRFPTRLVSFGDKGLDLQTG
jgi:hypothetical protein